LQRGDNTNLGFDIDLDLLFSHPTMKILEQSKRGFGVPLNRSFSQGRRCLNFRVGTPFPLGYGSRVI
jgi:hypothetical protein